MIRLRNSFAAITTVAASAWKSRMLSLVLLLFSNRSFSFPLLLQLQLQLQRHEPTNSLLRPFSFHHHHHHHHHSVPRLLAAKTDFASDDFSQNKTTTSSTRKGRKNKIDDNDSTEDPFLGYAIDSFLRGDYDRPFADDAAAPNPLWGPGKTVQVALRSLRALDEPTPSHGAAVFLRFSLPLSRGERWGDLTSTRTRSSSSSSSTPSVANNRNPWKEILRGSLTPNMFARRLRASAFAELLDWTRLDVTEGTYSETKDLVGVPNIAFVNAALFFSEEGVEPSLVQFTLRKRAGVWLIDTARLSQKELFMAEADTSSTD